MEGGLGVGIPGIPVCPAGHVSLGPARCTGVSFYVRRGIGVQPVFAIAIGTPLVKSLVGTVHLVVFGIEVRPVAVGALQLTLCPGELEWLRCLPADQFFLLVAFLGIPGVVVCVIEVCVVPTCITGFCCLGRVI